MLRFRLRRKVIDAEGLQPLLDHDWNELPLIFHRVTDRLPDLCTLLELGIIHSHLAVDDDIGNAHGRQALLLRSQRYALNSYWESLFVILVNFEPSSVRLYISPF